MATVATSLSVPRSRDTGRQDPVKGPLRTVDDSVRMRVRRAIDAKGWDQKDLAIKLDLAPATITNLLKPGPPRQIKYLPRLLEVLGISDDLEFVARKWPDLPPEERAVIVALVAARTAKND